MLAAETWKQDKQHRNDKQVKGKTQIDGRKKTGGGGGRQKQKAPTARHKRLAMLTSEDSALYLKKEWSDPASGCLD